MPITKNIINSDEICKYNQIHCCRYTWCQNLVTEGVIREREKNVLFNDALNTFYLRLYGIRHMVKDHSDSEKGNPLPPHRLLLSINSKGSFICTIPQADNTYHGLCYTSRGALAGTRNSSMGSPHEGLIRRFIAPWANALTTELHLARYLTPNPIDDHSNISSKMLQKQNFKPLGHYTCMQCGTSYLQTVQENILSRIILATYRKFTVATFRFTQNARYQHVANVTV